jgi:hypothetical protein
MKNRAIETSPKFYARIAGILYLYIMIAGSFAELFVRSKLVVSGDAEATAVNITANEFLFRLGFSGELLHLAFDVVIAMILYALLKPVDRNIALLAAFMRFACDIILAVASLSHFAALKFLTNADYLMSFQPEQLHTLALVAMKLHGDAYAISLVFFSFACLSLGYLIYKSGFLPKIIGALMTIAGVCYLISSFTHFLNPRVSAMLFEPLFIPIFIAELSLTFWLIVKGVDAAKWKEKVENGLSTIPTNVHRHDIS